MKFTDYIIRRDEMASFSLKKGGFIIPCDKLGLPCEDGLAYAVDMRFEDPDAYPHPYNELNQGSKFAAKVSEKRYLIYNGHEAEIMGEAQAADEGFLPMKKGKVDKSIGAISQKGFYLIPDDWMLHAQIFDSDYNVIKPAHADVTGSRARALDT